ncbi:MAG: HAD hydrolase family protein [Firmicutes bacterium]|nr:HAD hydrolase family protein [Bacillota bacterium]
MIEIRIPGGQDLALSHAIVDLNGTLATDGRLNAGVRERLRALAARLDVRILSADTHGSLEAVGGALGVAVERVAGGADKAAAVMRLRREGATGVVAIGNGRNDLAMFEAADLAIAVLGSEGAAAKAVVAADLVCTSGADALDLLLRPARLVAGLRP